MGWGGTPIMGYENWQTWPTLRIALGAAPVRLVRVDGLPSVRRRLAVVVGLSVASWAALIGGVSALVWTLRSLGAFG